MARPFLADWEEDVLGEPREGAGERMLPFDELIFLSYVDDLLKGFLDQCVSGDALLGRDSHTLDLPQSGIGHDPRSTPFGYHI